MSVNNYGLMRNRFPIGFIIWKLAFDPNLGHCPKFEICNWPKFGAMPQILAIPDIVHLKCLTLQIICSQRPDRRIPGLMRCCRLLGTTIGRPRCPRRCWKLISIGVLILILNNVEYYINIIPRFVVGSQQWNSISKVLLCF